MHYEIDRILLDSYKAVYVEVPKVACTSIKTALAQVLGISLKVTGGNPHDIDWPTPQPRFALRGAPPRIQKSPHKSTLPKDDGRRYGSA